METELVLCPLMNQLTTELITVSFINAVYLLVDTFCLQGNFILLFLFLKFFNLYSNVNVT